MDVAEQLQTIYKERFGIDLTKESACIASDTCPTAANVADVLEADQHDCEMHIVQLVMGYGLGANENTRTSTETDEKGVAKKVQRIVTPGGAFPEGSRLIKCCRTLGLFFNKSPQRISAWDTQRDARELPKINFVDLAATRVGSIVMMFQSLMANYCLFSILQACDVEDFDKVWSKLSDLDFKSIQEMEAITNLLFSYAANDSQQSNAFNNFLLPYFRKALIKALYRDSYKVMCLGKQSPATRLKNWPRESRHVEDFTPNGLRCLARLREQLKLRMKAPKAYQCLSVLLDPVTKQFAENLLDEEGLFDSTRALLKEKHRDA